MHLSRKKKLILAWSIPAVAVVAAVAVATPIVIINETNKRKTFDSAPIIKPLGFNEISDQEYLNSLMYNPKNFDVNFFASRVQESQSFANSVFYFQDAKGNPLNKVVSYDKNGEELVVWKNKNGVQYEIKSIFPDWETINNESSNEYVFKLDVLKSYKTNEKIYREVISIPASAFVSKEESAKNFVSSSAKIIRKSLLNNEISFEIAPGKEDTITSVDKITQTGDVVISPETSNYFPFSKKQDQVSTYIPNGDEFSYLNQNVEFSIPSVDGSNTSITGLTRLVFEANEAYSFTAKDKFDTTSPLYTFLNKAEKDGNLLFLPELTDEEKNGLSLEQQKEKQIQKLIFDSSALPYSIDEFGNEVPSNSSQAVVVKVQMGEIYTYLVSWTNLFKISLAIIENAPELKMEVKQKNGTMLTSSQLMDSANFGFIQPTSEPDPNLTYTVKSVEFASDDTYKTKAIVTVEISNPALPTNKKTYKTEITKGFASIAYEELDKQIKALLGSSTNLNPITPIIALKSGVDGDEFLKTGETELSKFEKSLVITPPSGLTNVTYKLVSVRISGNTFEGTFKICSTNDLNNYWKVNNTEQVVRKQLVVSSTT